MSTPDHDDGQVKPFAAVIQEIGKGAAHSRLSTALAELVQAVTTTEKKGTLTITITVEPTKGMDTLTVAANCTVKLPQEQQASIFFTDERGNLRRDDPSQPTLPLRGLTHKEVG